MKTNIYIDGLNLYYRAVQGTPNKWLNIVKLFQEKYPENNIHKIKYFTSIVQSRDDDPSKPERQQIYLRALQTFPQIEIIKGRFQTSTVRMPLAHPPHDTVEVLRTEEKSSDVNLAVHLLNDAHNKDYEVAIVVSNDSDLAESIRIVTRDINLRVGIVFPYGAVDPYTGTLYELRSSTILRKYATFIGVTKPRILSNNQLPNTLTDAKGTFHKPPEWQ